MVVAGEERRDCVWIRKACWSDSLSFSDGLWGIEPGSGVLRVNSLVDKIRVGEFVERVSCGSWREQCLFVYFVRREWVVVLENDEHELSAGREVHQPIEALLFN